jgi:hypothetical protein
MRGSLSVYSEDEEEEEEEEEEGSLSFFCFHNQSFQTRSPQKRPLLRVTNCADCCDYYYYYDDDDDDD